MTIPKPEFPRTGGCMRRAIDIKTLGPDRVQGWLEDDFHYFGVTITHDGEKVVEVDGESRRFPYSSCPSARLSLRGIIGMPLVKRCTDIGNHTDMRSQCTHMFDLAGLVIAHAAHGREHRRYDAINPDRTGAAFDRESLSQNGRTRPQLFQDGKLVLEWELEGDTIVSPEAAAGVSLSAGFRGWTEKLEDLELAEWANILRRTIFISVGRMIDVDAAEGHARPGPPACHTHQPGIAEYGRRMVGSTLDHTDHPEFLLDDMNE